MQKLCLVHRGTSDLSREPKEVFRGRGLSRNRLIIHLSTIKTLVLFLRQSAGEKENVVAESSDPN